MSPDPFGYDERVVAVIDILGFSALVEASNQDGIALAKVGDLLRTDVLFSKFLEIFDSAQGAFFSDTFVLSMPFPRTQTFYMVREVGHLCQYLFMQGLPCRGAVCAGPLHHKGAYLAGPALVRAHELERSRAVHPRVVLDPSALDHWSHDVVQGSSLEMFGPLVRRDADGNHFIDIFSDLYPANFYQWTNFVEGFDPLPPHPEFIAKAKQFVDDCLQRYAANDRILAKYRWLEAQLQRQY